MNWQKTGILICILTIPSGIILAEQSQIAPNTLDVQTTSTTPDNSGLSDLQTMGYGCIIGASALMAITAAVGPVEVIQIFAGGILVPSSSQVLWTSLTMGAGAQTCAAAALATPAILHAWNKLWSW